MKSLKSLLQKKSNKSALWKGVRASLIVEETDKIIEKILGQRIKSQLEVVCVKDKVLTVSCYSSMVSQEVKMHEKEILQGINIKVGESIVERIKYSF